MQLNCCGIQLAFQILKQICIFQFHVDNLLTNLELPFYPFFAIFTMLYLRFVVIAHNILENSLQRRYLKMHKNDAM